MSSLEASKLPREVSNSISQVKGHSHNSTEQSDKQNIQVVDVGVKHFHVFEFAGFGVLEIERREPVVAVVTLDQGCAAVGCHQVFASRSETEAASAQDAVNVTGDFSRCNDGVHSTLGELLVCEAKNGKCSFVRVVFAGGDAVDEGQQGRCGSQLHVDGVLFEAEREWGGCEDFFFFRKEGFKVQGT